jgi:hypothetical protein
MHGLPSTTNKEYTQDNTLLQWHVFIGGTVSKHLKHFAVLTHAISKDAESAARKARYL